MICPKCDSEVAHKPGCPVDPGDPITDAEETPNGDFYEEDEPIEDIKAAWEKGEKGYTFKETP